MRQLHPVSFHERFVASGTYVWSQDGVATGDVEHWTVHEPGPGAWSLRADYDGRAGSGTSWLFEGFYDRARRRLDRFDLSLYGAQHTEAKFIFAADEVQISLRVDGKAKDRLDLPLAEDVAPCPPALVAAYLFVPGLLDSISVFLPDVDYAAGLVRGGGVELISTEYRDSEPVVIGEKAIQAMRISLYGEQGMSTDICLDAHDILLRLETPTRLVAQLTQYVHRPETTS